MATRTETSPTSVYTASTSSSGTNGNGADMALKQSRYYYFRLESESSDTMTTSDTETIYSIQSKETDFAKDTTDTDTKYSDSEILEIEYDLASLSDRDEISSDDSGPSFEDGIILAAAAICNNSSNGELPATDCEYSDTESHSSVDSSPVAGINFWLCLMCRSQNATPEYQLCEKCYQSKKTSLPPRPRPRRKAAPNRKSTAPRTLNLVLPAPRPSESIGSSQDSGIGGSNSSCSLNDSCSRKRSWDVGDNSAVESSAKRANLTNDLSNSTRSSCNDSSNDCTSRTIEEKPPSPQIQSVPSSIEDSTLCIMCSQRSKDSIFLHGRTGHMSCCYSCSLRTWKAIKRCPICNRNVSNIVKVFSN